MYLPTETRVERRKSLSRQFFEEKKQKLDPRYPPLQLQGINSNLRYKKASIDAPPRLDIGHRAVYSPPRSFTRRPLQDPGPVQGRVDGARRPLMHSEIWWSKVERGGGSHSGMYCG